MRINEENTKNTPFNLEREKGTFVNALVLLIMIIFCMYGQIRARLQTGTLEKIENVFENTTSS